MGSTQQTLRVTGLPAATVREDVENFFSDHIQTKGSQLIEEIGPICPSAISNTKQTTITFSSQEAARKALQLEYSRRRLTAVRGGDAIINLDADFGDISILYSVDNPETKEPDIDIVALHGLTGHAWNTFTAMEEIDRQGRRKRENNWLRDNLPQLLQQHPKQSIHARVMTFGYNADVWMTKSVADLNVPVNNLRWYLNIERQHDPHRPLFFIGHSLGGIVIKETIVSLANEAMQQTFSVSSPSQGRYVFPVKGCLFFGVPHKGAEIADSASGFLNLLSKVFNLNKNNVQDLRAKSQRLANISSEFRTVQEQLRIPVSSFYETVEYSRTLGLIVSRDSAIFEYADKPAPFGVDKNHKDMAKFLTDDDHALRPAVHFIADVARNAIRLRKARDQAIAPPPPPGPTDEIGIVVEDRFSILESYDTVFLIDDSPSMRGEKWEMVQKILDYSTVVATRYDTDGIDIHFLNNIKFDQDNVRDPEIAVQIHHDVELRGNTPLLDKLLRHLKGYMRKYKDSGWSLDFKGYNLIVLTDGEPNEEYEDDGDISDHEDAKKNKPAFRLIRKKIVEIARKLDHEDVEAELGQVGIQFCQIGNNEDATVFFRFLDDRLKGKHNLGRDMVDTVKCQSELDLTESFFQKLLLGAIDRREDNTMLQKAHSAAKMAPHDSPPSNSAVPHRPNYADKFIHPHFSDDDTLVGRSTRYNSFPANSTLQTLHEAEMTGGPVSRSPTRMQTLPHRPSSSASTRHSWQPPATQHVQRNSFDQFLADTDPGESSLPRAYTSGSMKSVNRWPFHK